MNTHPNGGAREIESASVRANAPSSPDANASVSATGRLDLDALRAKLASSKGRTYWRSLEELADSPAFQAELAATFPSQEALWRDPVNRRSFLQLMGASLSLAGLGACTRQPLETILPWAASPESSVPGVPRFFATAFPLGVAGQGLLVESHMGRPTKIEGNPLHPSSLGATDALAQAQVLGLYDPERSQTVLENGRISTWADFLTAQKSALDVQRAKGGAGLRILSRTVSSPTLAGQRAALLALLPNAVWHQYEPINRDAERAGALQAFGRDVALRHDFARADVVLALDADFLARGPGATVCARAFAAGRRARSGATAMNRLYAVECSPGLTGAAADHRLAVRPSELAGLALAFARALGVNGVLGSVPSDFPYWDWVRETAKDLGEHRGRSLVLAGPEGEPAVHALVHALNEALGNVGATVVRTEPLEPAPVDQMADLRALVDAMRAGEVEVLVVLGANPLYETPGDLDFAGAFERVPLRVHLGHYVDETAARSHWHVPQAHFLESFGDVRGHDGTATVLQPLIAPLYDGRSDHELVAALAGQAGAKAYDLVREHWRAENLHGEDFEGFWERALHDGVVPGTALPPLELARAGEIDVTILRSRDGEPGTRDAADPHGAGTLELALRPDAHVWDGRFANNGWLQELPKPVTRLTWDNAALVGPRTAQAYGLADGDVVELAVGGARLSAPAWIVPGHVEGSVTLHLGYGRTHGGKLAVGAGVDAYRLQSSDARFARTGVTLAKTGGRARLACTQDHHGMEPGFTGDEIRRRAAELVRVQTFDRFKASVGLGIGAAGHAGSTDAGEGHGAGGADGHGGGRKTLLDPAEHAWDGHAWGMVIDLNACIGCSACTIACQAENNIPVVGKAEVARGREMHWIRVDRYFTGSLDAPKTHHQPVPCMHCEEAPCELVCPVGATVHGKEGLNEMVYNRCVGTRYCSNNCPYKVRRFNFFQYADYDTKSLALLRNPDVTVRYRGVMEKCTYCVQRINAARITAKKDGRPIADGEVVTACQQVCPTQAIAFGDIHDPASAVSALRVEPHGYGLLDLELNTRPRTTYLGKVVNENPRLVALETPHAERAEGEEQG